LIQVFGPAICFLLVLCVLFFPHLLSDYWITFIIVLWLLCWFINCSLLFYYFHNCFKVYSFYFIYDSPPTSGIVSVHIHRKALK
jgi:hypothetical protein